MRQLLLLFTLQALAAASFAQQPLAARVAAGESNREELIQSALARDRGEITAMEAFTGDGGGMVVGYSSGIAAHCFGSDNCVVYSGIPSGAVVGAVRDIAISRQGGEEIVWLAYPQGLIYRCRKRECREFVWAESAAGN